MNAKVSRWYEKAFLFRVYQDLWHTEKALRTIKQKIAPALQLSLLGTFPSETDDDHRIELLKSYREQLLDPSAEHGFFYNSEIGTVFILGPLTSTFLYEIEEKVLGSIRKGPYGILRGFGVDEKTAQTYVNTLKLGGCLLIIRGYNENLFVLENILKE